MKNDTYFKGSKNCEKKIRTDPFSLNSAPEIVQKKQNTYTKSSPFANEYTAHIKPTLPTERTS